jgi:hypothetical protein
MFGGLFVLCSLEYLKHKYVKNHARCNKFGWGRGRGWKADFISTVVAPGEVVKRKG